SGRANLTENHEGLSIIHTQLKKFAMFGHFEGVKMDEGPKAGDIIIVRLEKNWFWLIPVSPTKVSVGCVMDQDDFVKSKLSPADAFHNACHAGMEMLERMKNARVVNTIQATSD